MVLRDGLIKRIIIEKRPGRNRYFLVLAKVLIDFIGPPDWG